MAKVKISELAERYNMSTKTLIDYLVGHGIQAKRKNSSVDEDAAVALLDAKKPVAVDVPQQVAKVVNLDEVREKKTKKTAKKKGSGSDEWYAKYPWVVKDSVREPSAEDKKVMGSRCHGKVCTVKCVDTGAERVVNTQDAFQSKRSPDAQKSFMRRRRAERRQARKEAKAAKKVQNN